jgi:NitT/TauT family transport system ATP-binding protein
MTVARKASAPERTADATPAVAIDSVSVTFTARRSRVNALRDVSFDVAPGEFVAIVGPSGCGKSTLLKLAAGLTRPTSGRVDLFGTPVTGPRPDIGFVFQRAALLEWRSVRRNITLQAELRHLRGPAIRDRVDSLIKMTGLSGFEDAWPHELSGGMQQRVSLCRALVHEPPVLLMDEPFGALDALTREQMNTELHRIWRETQTTVLLVTHSVAEACFLASRVIVLSARPGAVLEIVPVGLPPERDYAAALADPVFGRAAAHIRELLGARSVAD